MKTAPCTVLALTLSLFALSSATAATLVYGAGGDPVSLESGNINDTNSAIAQNQIYDTLTKVKPGSTSLAPGLASSWFANPDRTVWTFNLRRGVKFHDGTPFNADAVVFNVSRWWDPAAPDRGQKAWESWLLIFGAAKGEGSALRGVRKNGEYQVIFTLTRPLANFPEMIGANFFGIASPAAVRKAGATYGTPAGGAVGTGPFRFQSWVTGQQVNLTANTAYWGSKPQVERLVLRSIKDPSARLNELKAGTVDFACDLNPESLRAVRDDKNLAAVLRPSFNVGFLSLNTRQEQLRNVKVRQAIRLALNRRAIAEAFWGDLGVSDDSFLPPPLAWANSKKVTPVGLNVAAAKKLLAEAGYPSGFTLDLWYMPVSRPYFPTPKPIAEAMAADLAAIGIKTNLKTEDWAKYLEDRNKAPGFDMYMIGWTGQFGAPGNFYDSFYGPGGVKDSNFDSPQVQALLTRASGAKTRGQQAALYGQVHELTHAAAVRIPIIHSRPLCAARTSISGWVPNPSNSEQFNLIRKR
ncbi:peptide/nickel transport system substrate-binding protein [Deinococcus reticulitermitis]|uniref:Peptide/nickel transport system substrate-binding protein n=1 Tax=Deinococcus reticulitermitis TaxID=856736 RepID=A0A1H6SE95_9DEIO|nr:ABC transporter substrate-binding protein [Deinococcus reticulitermitis]SEI62075.1 peptide/nickel transport system substrate-binding protein [Deinococcus reticulitermitis]